MKSWDKFCLLMWKNLILLIRRPVQTFLVTTLPLTTVTWFLYIRQGAKTEVHPDTTYPVSSVETSNQLHLSAYSPNNSQFLNNVMLKINSNMKGFANSKDLDDYLVKENKKGISPPKCLGIEFDDDLPENPKNFKKSLRIKIRCTNTDFHGWHTESLFPPFVILYGPLSNNPMDLLEIINLIDMSPSVPYADSQFVASMYAITINLYNTFNPTKKFPTLYSQRFPYPSYEEDMFVEIMGMSSNFAILLSLPFAFICCDIVRSITLEKEKQLKESMKIMGLPTWLHWTAWFFQFFLVYIVIFLIISAVFKFNTRNGRILPNSDWFCIFLFFLLLLIGLITFSFMLSVFFSKANRATALAFVVWILSSAPFPMVHYIDYKNIGPFIVYLTSLMLSCAVFYGFELMFLYESRLKGIQWDNLFETTIEHKFSFGGILMMMLIDAFVYLAIALYVEQVFPGEFGMPKKWYFIFTSKCCFSNRVADVNGDTYLTHDNEYFEHEPTNLKPGIKIKNIGKYYGSSEAVKKLSLNLYEDQITVLLGHNGAGKTTLMSMLAGMYQPSYGTALINGYDIRTQTMKVRDSMGLCLQHNVLFDKLTVKEHLQFFSSLKGCKGKEVKEEVEKFLDLLNLRDNADSKSETLSGGMKRKLSVGIALCGNSKVVLLDEPTSGMDPSARRFIWEFLQKVKKGKTILLTTHFMDEADLLGDRIAIMCAGEVKCCGSSFFLKKKFGTGYYLIIDKLPHCQPENITKILKKYIPEIHMKSSAGTEIIYILPENKAENFPNLLSEIENNTNSLGIRSFGISLSNLEEIFMLVGTSNSEQRSMINNEPEVTTYESKGLVSGCELLINQIHAIALKKILSTVRAWVLELVKIFVPVLVFVIMLFPIELDEGQNYRNFSLDQYPNPVTIVQNSSTDAGKYISMIKKLNHEVMPTQNITKTILGLTKDNPMMMRYKYVVGASFNETLGPIALYNGDIYHSLPLSVELLLNLYFKNSSKRIKSINFINYPLPRKENNLKQQFLDAASVSAVVSCINLIAIFIGTFFLLFVIKERVSQTKHLQFVSGVNVFVFWLIAFIVDFVTFVINIIASIITIVIFQIEGLSSAYNLGAMTLLFIMFGFAVMPYLYVFSFLFTIPSTGYMDMFILLFSIGYPSNQLLTLLENFELPGIDEIRWILRIFPSFDFNEALTNVLNSKCVLPELESLTEEQTKELFCKINPESVCCGNISIFRFTKGGIGIDIVMMFLIFLLSFIILFLIDLKIFSKLKYILCPSNIKPKMPSIVDEDVENENKVILNTPLIELQSQFIIILKNLTKKYGSLIVVNGLNLRIKKYECFGLLGSNGAGKTTTFKMMTGDASIGYGNGWIDGKSIKTQMKEVQKIIGYCPQFASLLNDLTARETIKIFCLIRGIPRSECNLTAEKLARDFDFMEHIDKKVKELSGGNKRKLSTSIALIGDSPILILDEPSTGMDPASKRYLWNQLSKIRESGKSIIITSHSMEECEALCTRLAIMVNGNLQCLGSTQHLKSRFAEGFFVTIKIKKLVDQSGLEHADTINIERFMLNNFPNSELKEKHQELLTYYIKDRNVKWSQLFSTLEKAKKILNIEDYSIGQASLEQIFLTLTKEQISEENVKKRKKCCGIPCFCC